MEGGGVGRAASGAQARPYIGVWGWGVGYRVGGGLRGEYSEKTLNFGKQISADPA